MNYIDPPCREGGSIYFTHVRAFLSRHSVFAFPKQNDVAVFVPMTDFDLMPTKSAKKLVPKYVLCKRCNTVPEALTNLKEGDPLPKGIQAVGKHHDQIRCASCNAVGTQMNHLGLSFNDVTFSKEEQEEFYRNSGGLKGAGIKKEWQKIESRSHAIIQEKRLSRRYKPAKFWADQGYGGGDEATIIASCEDYIDDSKWGRLYNIDELSKEFCELNEDRVVESHLVVGKPKGKAKPKASPKMAGVPKSTTVADWAEAQHEPYKALLGQTDR